jgi:hypothetical protein
LEELAQKGDWEIVALHAEALGGEVTALRQQLELERTR